MTTTLDPLTHPATSASPPEAANLVAPPDAGPAAPPAVDPDLARVLTLRVPVIVRLAQRTMSVGAIRKFSMGLILEFDKPVDEPLDLLVNNQRIGCGETVRIGERFGLRIERLDVGAQRRSVQRQDAAAG